MALTEPVDSHVRGEVLARLVTDALLPSLELVAQQHRFLAWGPDGRLRALFENENIQSDLVFSRGGLTVDCLCLGEPDTIIAVESSEMIGALIKGRFDFPVTITRGVWRADLLGRFAGLLSAMAVSFATISATGGNADVFRLIVEIAMRAAAVVGAADPHVFDVIRGMEGEALTISNCSRDRYGTLTFYSDNIAFSRDSREPAAATLSLGSPALLRNIIMKKTDPMEAYSAGKINCSGESVLFVAMVYLLIRLCDHLDYHPWLQNR
ncbi:MAG: hypothetical protein WCX65_14140 [bacterium]